MKLLTAPTRISRDDSWFQYLPKVFLAGGISNCPNWQNEFIRSMEDDEVYLINPRRDDFDVNDVDMEYQQIKWEFDHFKMADAVVFWFPSDTLCPITLLEYGKELCGQRPLFVGTDPKYARRRDIIIQGTLAGRVKTVHDSLESLIQAVKTYLRSGE